MNTSNVTVYPGAEGIKAVYEQSLQADAIDIVCLAQDYTDVIGDYFDVEYSPRLYGKLKTREILPESEENREYAKQKDAAINPVRFLKVSKSSETDMLLFAGKAVLVSYNKQTPFALVIEDQELVNSLQNQFAALWKSIK